VIRRLVGLALPADVEAPLTPMARMVASGPAGRQYNPTQQPRGSGFAGPLGSPTLGEAAQPPPGGYLLTLPSAVSIESSTNFDATWSRGPKLTLKPP
jgi:hypothetical protein